MGNDALDAVTDDQAHRLTKLMTLSPENTPPEDKEECRLWIIARCEERIADARRMANEAHKECDWQGAALARHIIGENTRAIEKEKADAPVL